MLNDFPKSMFQFKHKINQKKHPLVTLYKMPDESQ